jgi:serine protease Do
MVRRCVKHGRFCIIIFLAALTLPLSSTGFAEQSQSLLDLSTAIFQVAKETIPAVVHIEASQPQEFSLPQLPFEDDPSFRYFFDASPVPKAFNRGLSRLGTGIILDAQGHILTNNHMVGYAKEIQVLLSGGKQYKAALIGADPKTDLAVIKIEAEKPLAYPTFGNSDKVDVGTWVVAIGHPRGLDHTVTHGIISAEHRRGITDPSSYRDFLQTDAAINPGNSGGPLLNLQGEVIGVNVAIVSLYGGFEGIGFAIPSNMAVHIAEELMAHGKVARGWLGVTVQHLTPELAETLGLEHARGALIADVFRGGPAEHAGMKRGDVVLAYRGKEICDVDSLRNEVAVTPHGERVKVILLREGKRRELSVQIGNRESATGLMAVSLKDCLGGELREVTNKEVQKYNLNAGHGLTVTELASNGSLAKNGFEVGDIILEINGQPVKDIKSFVDMLDSIRSDERITFLALDHRTGQRGYVQLVVERGRAWRK